MELGTAEVKYISDIIEQMTERQRAATEAVFAYDYTLYGGARGGGKSWWLRWMNVVLLLYWGLHRGMKGVRVGLFCESYPTLLDRQITKIEAEFPLWLGSLRESKTHGLAFHLPAHLGSGVLALRNLDDPSKYKSAEFAAVSVDQLEENKLDVFNILRGSKRWPGIAHTKFIAGANPGGVGHGYVKQYWIDRQYPPEMEDLAEQFVFVPAYPTDNPYLDANYWTELRSLPPNLSRAWVEGDWNIFEGQAFTQFRQHLHVCKPFTIPAWWPKWRAIDWGYAAPFCCLWFALDPDTGRVYVYREVYETGLTDRQQARLITALTPADEKIERTFADPSMWASKSAGESMTSTADEYKAEGVTLIKADNDRLTGKRRVDRLLGNLPDGKPGIVFFETCANLIRTLPALPYDKRNVEDIDTNAEDHPFDALKYGTTETTARPTQQQRKEPDLPPGYQSIMQLVKARL